MVRSSRALVAVLCLLVVAPGAFAQRNALKLGGSAPGFDVERWVTGEDTPGVRSGATNIIVFIDRDDQVSENVIAFYALFAGLAERIVWSELHVTFILSGDIPRDVINSASARPELEGFSSAALGIDRRNGTKRKWVDSAKKSTPIAFIVDGEGKVQHWYELRVHSRVKDAAERFGDILEKVSLGHYDYNLMRIAAPKYRSIETARKVKNWRQIDKTIDELLEQDSRVFAEEHLRRFEILLLDRADKEGAYAYAKKMITDAADDPALLTEVAQFITSNPKLKDEDRDLDVAMELAKAAAERLTAEDPLKFSIVASVHFHRGEIDEAMSLQKVAYRRATSGFMKDRMKHDLDIYAEARRQQRRTTRTP